LTFSHKILRNILSGFLRICHSVNLQKSIDDIVIPILKKFIHLSPGTRTDSVKDRLAGKCPKKQDSDIYSRMAVAVPFLYVLSI
jgi:hypothetical protein